MKLHAKIISTLVALAAAGTLAATAGAAAPTNTSPPTIAGTEQQGRTLTARNGTWTNSPSTFFYRWQRCSTEGADCTNVDNGTSKSYRLTGADVDHTIRVIVTASNSDGQVSANSKTTDVISATTPPKNTAAPTVTGKPEPGEELSATQGTWTGGARSYAYQWQRCNDAGASCADVGGANGRTYGVRGGDVGSTLRVVVTATNLAGSTAATSGNTAVVRTAPVPPPPAPAPSANHRPAISILSVRFVGARVYVRFRVCDDSRRNVRITQRDSKPGVPSYTRYFRTLAPPRSCAALTRSWLPAPRFRHGRYTIRLWARDAFGLTSIRPATRTITR
jgi:hypothetical protein